jgi:hypothetical protein
MTIRRRQGRPEHACVPVCQRSCPEVLCLQHIIPILTSPSNLAAFLTCHVTVTLLSVASILLNRYHCHVSSRPVVVGHVSCHVCQAGLPVWDMFHCHVSDRSVVVGHVPYDVSGWPVVVGHVPMPRVRPACRCGLYPMPRVRLACRCGPCPSATCQAGLSVWTVSQYNSPRLVSAAEQSRTTNATLPSLTLGGLSASGRPVTALCPGAHFDHTTALLH